MANKVIYFPYMRVPKNEWFTRILLYWDKVGSIVPIDYVYHPENLGKYMQELVKAELVTQIIPQNYIHSIPRFKEAFIELINRNQIITSSHNTIKERHETFLIHIEKLGNIADELCDKGLAKPKNYPWYNIEKVTAELFMAYLAAVLGRLNEIDMVPITDSIEYFSVFSKETSRGFDSITLMKQLRMEVLEGILPAPAGSVSIKELADFKSRYINLLSQFRRRVESFLNEVPLISDKNMRDERVRIFKEETREEINEIRSRMHERNWPKIVFGTFCGISAAAIPGIKALATRNIILALESLPGLLTAIYSAFNGTIHQKEIIHSPFAYAALAQERLT